MVHEFISTESVNTDSTPLRYKCVSCGQSAMNPDGDQCSICSGLLLADFDVDLDALTEGAEALSVSRVLARYTEVCGIEFALGENKLRAWQVFQPESILPVISIEAMRLWQCIEHPAWKAPLATDTLEVEFEKVSEGFFPMASYPAAIGSDISSTLRLLVFVLAARRVLGLKENSTIDLVPYISKWDNINWEGEELPDIPIPEGFDLGFQHREFATHKTIQHHRESNPTALPSVINPFASQQVKD